MINDSLLEDLKGANLFFMMEHGKDSKDFKNTLYEKGVPFFYMDEFYSANIEDMKREAVVSEIRKYISEKVNINLHTIFSEAVKSSKVQMGTAEKEQLFERYFKNIQASVSVKGDLLFEFNN